MVQRIAFTQGSEKAVWSSEQRMWMVERCEEGRVEV